MSADRRAGEDGVDTVDRIVATVSRQSGFLPLLSGSATHLPVGWSEASLGSVSDISSGIGFPIHLQGEKSGDLGFFKVSDISRAVLENQGVLSNPRHYVSLQTAKTLKGTQVVPGATVFAKIGEAIKLNRRAFVSEPCLVDNNVMAVKAGKALDDRFLHLFLRTQDLSDSARSTTVPSLRKGDIESIRMPLPPLPEQKRIADKLDRLLARVDACRERLDRVPALLKRFRQSVLAAATSGELTREWRAARHQESETGAGLPSTWDERKIGDLGNVQLGRQRSPKFHTGDSMRPYLRVQNVFEDRIDISDVMEMNFPPDDISRYELKYGDILLNEGQSPQFLGRPAMFRNEIPGACFTNTLIRFQAHRELVSPEYALLVFRHHMHSGRYVAEGNITTNIAHLGAGRFATVEFPLPPLDEQTEIVRRTESLFEMASKLEARLQEATALAQRTTPATLAKAFRGELVPQDPTDEPAAALLARIAAARDDAGAPARRGRRKATAPESRA